MSQSADRRKRVRSWGAVLVGIVVLGFLDMGFSAPVSTDMDSIRAMVDTLEIAQFVAKNILFSEQMEDVASFGGVVLDLLESEDADSPPLIPTVEEILLTHAARDVLDETANEGFEAILARVKLYLELAADEIRETIRLAADRKPLGDHREKASAFLFAAMGELDNPFVVDGLVDAVAMLPE